MCPQDLVVNEKKTGLGRLGGPALVGRWLEMHYKPGPQGASSRTPYSLLSAGRDGFRVGLKSGCVREGEGGAQGREDVPASSEENQELCPVEGQAGGLPNRADRGDPQQ